MKIIGIIAEYNPFHNGHAYQIEELKRRTGADYVIAAMSGDFVQRGEPAVADKYTRARMALACGVDLVCELPVLWATSSAEDFAMAGVTLFEKMGCVDGICFGAETDDLILLTMLADVLAEEPIAYRDRLSQALKQGVSFPSARAKALCGYLSDTPHWQGADHASLSALLECPNNILAIEYLKALKRRKSSLTPYLIPRKGAGYHDTDILSAHKTDTNAHDTPASQSALPSASASAIRAHIRDAVGDSLLPHGSKDSKAFLSAVLPAMPQEVTCILLDSLKRSPAVYVDDFSAILGYQLLANQKTGFADILGADEKLSNRMQRLIPQYGGFSQFCGLLKSRNVTYTRVSRVLTHLLLRMDASHAQAGVALDYIPYLRMLGFRQTGTDSGNALLSAIKNSSSVSLISKLVDAKTLLLEDAFSMLEDDIFAADLYEQVRNQKLRLTPQNGGAFPPQSERTREIVRM